MELRKNELLAVEGIQINLSSRDDTLGEILAARGGDSYSLYTLNLDHCVKLRTNSNFRQAYKKAKFVTADGAPIVWLARLLGINLSRVTGADLVEPMMELAAKNGLKVFFFGTSSEVLKQTITKVRQKHDDLNIVGSIAPSQNFIFDGLEADAVIDAINTSRASLCFVALGAPKQELFSARAALLTQNCGFICVGAALDFIAGVQVRSPKIFQKLGVEWVWRLGSNPSGMWRRYTNCAGLMAFYLLQAVPRRLRSQTHLGNLSQIFSKY